MNQTHRLFLAVICLTGITFCACNSSTQQHDQPRAQVQFVALPMDREEKHDMKAAQKASHDMELEAIRITFEAEFDRNQTRLTEIKKRMRRVSTLEQMNKNLKANIESYQHGQVDWNLYKRAFLYDMQALGKEVDLLYGHR